MSIYDNCRLRDDCHCGEYTQKLNCTYFNSLTPTVGRNIKIIVLNSQPQGVSHTTGFHYQFHLSHPGWAHAGQSHFNNMKETITTHCLPAKISSSVFASFNHFRYYHKISIAPKSFLQLCPASHSETIYDGMSSFPIRILKNMERWRKNAF